MVGRETNSRDGGRRRITTFWEFNIVCVEIGKRIWGTDEWREGRGCRVW